MWQVVVWGTRVDNVLADDGLTDGDKVLRVALSVSFLAFGAVAVWAWRQAGRSTVAPLVRVLVRVGAAWTVVVWVVRGADIALGDHAGAFIAVHLVLAVVSVALAVQAVRTVDGAATGTAISPPAASAS